MEDGDYIYIVERRSNRKHYPTIEEQNCFAGTTIEKCIDWIKKNKNYHDHESYWWWTMHSLTVNTVNNFLATMRYFDWDGKELEAEPLALELYFTHDFSKTKVGDTIYDRRGNQIIIQEIKPVHGYKNNKYLYAGGQPIVRVKFTHALASKESPSYARLIPTNEL